MTKNNIGKLGEDLVLIFLKKKGYKLVERNWLWHKVGEIDLILEYRKEIIFVEVKSSTNSFEEALQNFSYQKKRKFYKIVNLYIQQHKKYISRAYKLSLFLVQIDLDNKKSYIKQIDLNE